MQPGDLVQPERDLILTREEVKHFDGERPILVFVACGEIEGWFVTCDGSVLELLKHVPMRVLSHMRDVKDA
jgi:hypothetical protein